MWSSVSFHRSAFVCCAHENFEENGRKFKWRPFFFAFTEVYLEKHFWSARSYAPDSSVHKLCMNCLLSLSQFFEIDRIVDVCCNFRWYKGWPSRKRRVSFNPAQKLKMLFNIGKRIDSSLTRTCSTNQNKILKQKFYNASEIEPRILAFCYICKHLLDDGTSQQTIF